ncbi:CapA family protein [Rhodanobacter sp. UC4437_H4]|jgi:poly-gamma-glutamate synthesis protein (capsule biosynthesis protein)
MVESCNLQRRRLLAALAMTPLLPGVAVRAAERRELTLTLTGQALIAHDLCHEPYPGLAEVIAQVRRGDVAMTDLETPIRVGASGAPTRQGLFLHAAGPDALRCLRSFGFDMLALANNHAGDFGRAGVLATRSAAQHAGFATAGSGSDLAEASGAACFKARGRRVALVAMAAGKIRPGVAATSSGAGINELRLTAAGTPDQDDVERILQSIRAAAGTAFVVACLHNHDWRGDMRVTQPWAREFARSCAEAGAGAFFSHGAPLLHGIELHHGVPIFHGMGSLIFHSRTEPGYYPAEVWESMIAHLHRRDGSMRQLELVPVVLNERGDDASRQDETRGRPRIARGEDAQRILARLQSLSAVLGTSLRIAGERGWISMD